VSQVVAGLATVHKKNLVRIDLGLAKAISEPLSEVGISMPGVFAGTPEFASPEQFAGVPFDMLFSDFL
jgi:serine/threonine protein kinase